MCAKLQLTLLFTLRLHHIMPGILLRDYSSLSTLFSLFFFNLLHSFLCLYFYMSAQASLYFYMSAQASLASLRMHCNLIFNSYYTLNLFWCLIFQQYFFCDSTRYSKLVELKTESLNGCMYLYIFFCCCNDSLKAHVFKLKGSFESEALNNSSKRET